MNPRDAKLKLEAMIDEAKRHSENHRLIQLMEFFHQLFTYEEGEANAEQSDNAALSGGETPLGEDGQNSSQEITSSGNSPQLSEEGGEPSSLTEAHVEQGPVPQEPATPETDPLIAKKEGAD